VATGPLYRLSTHHHLKQDDFSMQGQHVLGEAQGPQDLQA